MVTVSATTIAEAIIGSITGITIGLAIVKLTFSIANAISRHRQNKIAEWKYLIPYVYQAASKQQTIERKSIPISDWNPATQIQIHALTKEWLKVRRLTPEQKLLTLQAGYSPSEAHKAYKQLGEEGLHAHIYLATGKQTNVNSTPNTLT